MPLGDEKHRIIMTELVNLLGEDYVADDPVILEAFSRESQMSIAKSKTRFEFIVMPGTTVDVQQIVRLANRCGFPFSMTSTGLGLSSCNPRAGYGYWCLIDPKRMNAFHIDAGNKYAVVEPYVTIAQLQAASMKVGLCMGSTGAGTQTSALATNIFTNTHWTGWRTGKGRSLLGAEVVLPDGEVIRTGSLALGGGDYSWGEGPGIDARGVFRGGSGPRGALGVFTRAAIKLYPWPGPPVLVTHGVQPEKTCPLPPELFKTIIFSHPTLESCFTSLREIGEAEIGGVVMQCSPHDLVGLASRSREEFWRQWQTETWQELIHRRHLTLVTLWGYAGAAQVAYEEKNLSAIIAETGGALIPESAAVWVRDLMTISAVRDTHRMRYNRMGKVASLGSSTDSLQDALRSMALGTETLKRFSPPLGDGGLFDRGQEQTKATLADFGRIATASVGCFAEKTPEFESLMSGTVNPYLKGLRKGKKVFSAGAAMEASASGKQFAGIHLLIAGVKRALDPNNVANPTRLIDMDKMARAGVGRANEEDSVSGEE